VPLDREPSVPLKALLQAQVIFPLLGAALMTASSIVALAMVVLDVPLIQSGIIFLNFGLVWLLPAAIAMIPVILLSLLLIPRRFITYVLIYAVVACAFATFEAASCWYVTFFNRTIGIFTLIVLLITTSICWVGSLMLLGGMIALTTAADRFHRWVTKYPHWTVQRPSVPAAEDDEVAMEAMGAMAGTTGPPRRRRARRF